MNDDLLGEAVLDFLNKNNPENIKTYSSLDEKDELPLAYLFRKYREMPLIEKKALQLCSGKVLDIGCGAGSHSIYLQKKGLDVTALDSSLGATKVCSARGIQKVVHSSILDYSGSKFDTLLLLMNGIGLAGTLGNLSEFLMHLKGLIHNKGQILLDSSDIIYMFDKDEDGGYWVPNNGAYYGEVEFTMTYKGITTAAFPWLYIDFNRLKEVASLIGLDCEMIVVGDHYDYLARLRLFDTI